MLNATTVVTAGHCTFGIGLNGASTTAGGTETTAATGGTDGNDVWINFNEAPDFSILPPSTNFTPSDNAGRYVAWSAALNRPVSALGEPRPVVASQPGPALKPAMVTGLLLLSNSTTEFLPLVTSWKSVP